ncbi:hypothetical protein EVAR_77630_1 [Eumeta japonica]|uniref:Craniofacial development protein 2 n=1 Tax=Eumeta variegata TaxID=151549 RepID=A0A4C1T9T2_EUMVA|nr:hypothetical protein EVAR_77630_1 [Eumeta japonica]
MTASSLYRPKIATLAKILKSPQSSNRPSQIASLPTTYRTALAIYEDWGLGMDTKAIRSSPIQLKEKIPCHKLIVGTWNVRGCATLDKKKLIDRQLHHLKVTIAGIQETHMTSGSFTSEHYIWILSGGKKAQETRGVGIIIRKNAISRIIKIQRKSNSVLGVHLELNSEPHSYHTDWLIITAHIPQWSTENSLSHHFTDCLTNKKQMPRFKAIAPWRFQCTHWSR